MAVRHDEILEWIIPCLLSATLGVLGWMAFNINRISEALVVVVYKIDNHEKRIEHLEERRDGRY